MAANTLGVGGLMICLYIWEELTPATGDVLVGIDSRIYEKERLGKTHEKWKSYVQLKVS